MTSVQSGTAAAATMKTSTSPPSPPSSSSATPTKAKKARVRSSRACAACVARKVKCDGSEACRGCAQMGVPCFYLPATRKRGPPKGCEARGGVRKKGKTEREGEEVDRKAASPRKEHSVHHVVAPSALMNPVNSTQPTPSSSSTFLTWAPSTSATSVTSLEHGFETDDAASSTKNISLDTMPGWNFFVPDVNPAKHTLVENPFVPWQMDDVNGNHRPHQHQQQHPHAPAPPPPVAHAAAPRRPAQRLPDHVVDSLLLIYETFIHPHWPVVYLPALRSLRMLDTQRPLLFDAILAISAANCDAKGDQSGIDGRTTTLDVTRQTLVALSEELIESVRQRAFAQGLEKGDVSTVQALVLVSLVDLGYGRSSLAYQMGGIACRMACDLGLNTMANVGTAAAHRRAESSIAGAGQEERRRTVWACYTLDKILAAILQRPAALRRADISTSRPSELERDELDLLIVGTAQQRFLHPSAWAEMDYVKSHALSTFNAWCDVMVILEQTLDTLYVPAAYEARINAASGRRTNRALVVEEQERFVERIDGALAQWRNGLPLHLQWNDDSKHARVAPHMLTVRGWFHTCQILLHRPRVPHLYYQTITSPRPFSGDVDAVEALRLLKQANAPRGNAAKTPAVAEDVTTCVPNGLDAAQRAATSLCQLMEAYEETFKVRKFPSSWVYLVFQAGTVHAGLALPSAASSSGRTMSGGELEQQQHDGQASMRLDQCIGWLDQIAVTWVSASHHVRLLRRLSEVGANTRPSGYSSVRRGASPSTPAASTEDAIIERHANTITASLSALCEGDDPNSAALTGTDADHNSAIISQDDDAAQAELLSSWSLFWGGMPTTSEDVGRWQDFSGLFE